jgi:hypothetical protein
LERSNFKLSESVIKATANNGFLKVSNRREGHSFLGGTLPSSWFTVKLDVILGGSISKPGAPTNLLMDGSCCSKSVLNKLLLTDEVI